MTFARPLSNAASIDWGLKRVQGYSVQEGSLPDCFCRYRPAIRRCCRFPGRHSAVRTADARRVASISVIASTALSVLEHPIVPTQRPPLA